MEFIHNFFEVISDMTVLIMSIMWFGLWLDMSRKQSKLVSKISLLEYEIYLLHDKNKEI